MLHPIARGMQQGQTVLRRPRTAAWALLGAALLSWAAQIGGIYAALAAADIHPTIGARRARLPRLDARAAVPVLARQRRPLPGRGRAGARAGLPHRLPARARVRGRAAGDRGQSRRRPRLLVPLARGPLAGRGARPPHRRLRSCFRRTLPAFRGAPRPPRGGASPAYPSRYAEVWAGSPPPGCARPRRCSRARCSLLAVAAPRGRIEAPARPQAGGARCPRGRAHGPGAVPLAQGQARAGLRPADRARPPLPRRRCRRCTCASRAQAAARARAAGSGRCAPRASSTRAGRTSCRSSCARRATPTRPSRPTALRVTAVAAGQRDRHVRRLAGRRARRALRAPVRQRQGDRARRGCAAHRPGPRLRHDVHAARARRRRAPATSRGLARRPRPHAPCTDNLPPGRARQRARDHGRGHERRARLGSRARLRRQRDAATRCTATACCSGSPTARASWRAPRARHAVQLHRRRDRRRRASLAATARWTSRPRRRCPRPAPPTPTCWRRRARASTTSSATTCRSRPSRRPTSTSAPTSPSSGRTTRS